MSSGAMVRSQRFRQPSDVVPGEEESRRAAALYEELAPLCSEERLARLESEPRFWRPALVRLLLKAASRDWEDLDLPTRRQLCEEAGLASTLADLPGTELDVYAREILRLTFAEVSQFHLTFEREAEEPF